MTRRKTLEKTTLTHPATGEQWTVKLMDDGGIDLVVAHGGAREHVVRHVFQAGTETQISLRSYRLAVTTQDSPGAG